MVWQETETSETLDAEKRFPWNLETRQSTKAPLVMQQALNHQKHDMECSHPTESHRHGWYSGISDCLNLDILNPSSLVQDLTQKCR